MGYCTREDLIARFGEEELVQLTDRASLGAIDVHVLDQARADADAEIEGYLVGRYSLPLPSVPPVLVRIACDITRYHLYDAHATEHVRNRYRDAARLLEQIGIGKVQLGMPNSAGALPAAGGPDIDAPARTFSADTLRDF